MKGTGIQVSEIVEKVLELNNKWHLSCVVIDPWQMVGAGQELCNHGLGVKEMNPTAENQRSQAAALLRGFRERLVELFDEPRLLQDLRSASVEETGGFGAMKICWPKSAAGHCDLGVSFTLLLPLALNTLEISPEPMEVVFGQVTID